MRDASGRALLGNRFILEIDAVQMGVFQECTGLGMSLDIEAIEEGGNNHFVHQAPGRMRWNNITLKRGVVSDSSFFEWISRCSGEGYAAAGNRLERSTGAVTAVDEQGTRVVTWTFLDCLPVRWTGPTFGASKGEALAEELEIAHHGIKVQRV